MKKKIAIIACYFGKLPNYFPLWLNSCGFNKEISWFVFTDDEAHYEYFDNVKIISLSFEDVKQIVENKLDFDVNITNPYKFCDFKVLYGKIFEDYIKDYTHWGHCDLDVIFGDLTKFITNDKLEKYDRLYDLGHLSIYKNTDIVNEHYKMYYSGLDYRVILGSPYHFGFDESKGLNLIYQENKLPMLIENVCADINYRNLEFHVNRTYNTHDYFEFCEGQIWGCNDGQKTVEYSYIHLQKRKMKYTDSLQSREKYYIFPDCFSESNNLKYNYIDKVCFKLRSLCNELNTKIRWNYHWKYKWMSR